MNGFRAEPVTVDGKTTWFVYSLDSQKLVSTGRTLREAVESLEESDGESP